MQASFFSESLFKRLSKVSSMQEDSRKLIILLGLLGDFDSLEYGQLLALNLSQLENKNIKTLLIGIGSEESSNRFSSFTGFPRDSLIVEKTNSLHLSLGLSPGLQLTNNSYINLLLMCMGFGSPGTIHEVIRGYVGDLYSNQRIFYRNKGGDPFLPFLQPKFFSLVFGDGYLRPFELATVRLMNMIEVLSNWNLYMFNKDYLTQRGATYFLETDNSVLYSYKSKALLDFTESKGKPLSFLNRFIS
ncbi:AhpC/TSA family protein [Prochlorococcus sp. MIT 1341]|uniref:AhpC/TSA family protein n=1 Tax=Prochlorococcus sp. MIT 1341 TaxID=3096221 RepID=UPI002A75D5FE|nr:AhpC/TSA family protein [Prochlorococcus sp. MIT 1341]